MLSIKNFEYFNCYILIIKESWNSTTKYIRSVFNKILYKMKYFILMILTISVGFACSVNENDTKPENDPQSELWLVDTLKMTGTKVTEAFPVVTEPVYVQANKAPIVNSEDEKAIVFKIKNEIYIYPIRMMGVEVVNDMPDDVGFAVTYCPKTKTSYVINRNLNDKIYTFKASGLLYQDNLVYYDLESESYWSQMLFQSIHGPQVKQSPTFIPSLEMNYNAAVNKFPDAQVFINYPSDGENLKSFAVSKNTADGELVMGFLDLKTKPDVLPVLNFDKLSRKGVFHYGDLLVVINKDYLFIKVFNRVAGRTFEFLDDFPYILKDNEGNVWNIFGMAVSGPATGEQMEEPVSFMAQWWAWRGIYDSFDLLNATLL